MKNHIEIFVLAVIISLFSSCSNDDTNTEQVASLNRTIKKYSEKVYYNGQIDYQFSSTFNYENGKLISISDSQNKLEFSYNSGKITEVKKYVNNQLITTNFLSYNGNLLSSIVNGDNDERTLFSYNSGLLATIQTQYFDGGNWFTSVSKNYTLQATNIKELITENFSFSYSSKSTFEYDSKNNPMKHMNPIVRLILQYETCDFISNNNVLERYSYPDVNSINGTLSSQYTITYDSDNYPTLIKKYGVSNNQQELISEAIIEYN